MMEEPQIFSAIILSSKILYKSIQYLLNYYDERLIRFFLQHSKENHIKIFLQLTQIAPLFSLYTRLIK